MWAPIVIGGDGLSGSSFDNCCWSGRSAARLLHEAMSGLSRGSTAANADISKWNVSSVTDMSRMFSSAKVFDADLSAWNVSSVRDMSRMFDEAMAFSGDLSKWDVSQVEDMSRMFHGASAFTQKLCAPAWVNSKANKNSMFDGTSGSISPTVCAVSASAPAFAPQSRTELKSAVDTRGLTCSAMQ